MREAIAAASTVEAGRDPGVQDPGVQDPGGLRDPVGEAVAAVARAASGGVDGWVPTPAYRGRHPLPPMTVMRSGARLSWSAAALAWTHVGRQEDALVPECATNLECNWEGALRFTTCACFGFDHADLPTQDVVTQDPKEIAALAVDFVYNCVAVLDVDPRTITAFLESPSGTRAFLEPAQVLQLAEDGVHAVQEVPRLRDVMAAVDWHESLSALFV